MTKLRRKPSTKFHAFIVEPTPDFEPTNWRQTPTHYRIVRYLGPKEFKGSADAWKFMHNHEALHEERSGKHMNEWALYLDFETPIFPSLDSDQADSNQATFASVVSSVANSSMN
ncbi:MAG: hypothetical protein AB8B55_13880 [Mariniblastus sp.]